MNPNNAAWMNSEATKQPNRPMDILLNLQRPQKHILTNMGTEMSAKKRRVGEDKIKLMHTVRSSVKTKLKGRVTPDIEEDTRTPSTLAVSSNIEAAPVTQWPSCSMPTDSTSGYAGYHERSEKQMIEGLKTTTKLLGKAEVKVDGWPSCSMPGGATSGYSSYHDRTAVEVAEASKTSIDMLFAKSESQSKVQWPTCSMPSAPTSGYNDYSERSSEAMLQASKASAGAWLSVQPNSSTVLRPCPMPSVPTTNNNNECKDRLVYHVSGRATKCLSYDADAKSQAQSKVQWPTCSMPSAPTSGYNSYGERSIEAMLQAEKEQAMAGC